MLDMPVYFLAPAVLLSVLLCAFVMPLIYDAINNISLVSTGKYHLVFAAVTLMLSVSYGYLFSIDASWSFSLKAAALFFALFFTFIFYMVYTSVLSSISSRIYEKNEKYGTLINNLFIYLGAALFIAALIFFANTADKDMYSQIGYLGACTVLLTGFSVFLASTPYMPRFIRLEVPKRRTFAMRYEKFFLSFTRKDNRRSYIYFFLMSVAVQTVAVSALSLKKMFGLENIYYALAALSLIFFAAAAAAFSKLFKRKNGLSVIVCGILYAVPTAALIVLSFFELSHELSVSLLFSCCALYGFGTGIFINSANQMFEDIFDRSSTTRGTLVNIKNILFFASFVIAFSVVGVAALFQKYFVLIALSVSFVFLAAAFMLKTIKKRYLTLDFPEGFNDTGI